MALAEFRAVGAAFGDQRNRLAARQLDLVERIRQAVGTAGDDDLAALLVDIGQAADAETVGCHLMGETAIRLMQLDLPLPGPLGRPQEAAAIGQPARKHAGGTAIAGVGRQLDPGLVRLGQQHLGGAGPGVDRQQTRLGLGAVHHQDRERSVLRPDHPGDIGEFLVIPLRPHRSAPDGGDDSQLQLGIVGAGARIAIFVRRAGRIDGAGDVMGLDGGIVGFLIGQEAPVGRPPGPVLPVQFLGGDEIGGAAQHGGAGAAGQRGDGPGGEIDGGNIPALHRGQMLAVRRQARRDPAFAGNSLHRPVGARNGIELAAQARQHGRAVIGQLKFGEAFGGDAGALAPGFLLDRENLVGTAQQFLRRHQFRLAAGGQIIFVEMLGCVAGGSAEVNHRLAVRRGHRLGGIAQLVTASRRQIVETIGGFSGGRRQSCQQRHDTTQVPHEMRLRKRLKRTPDSQVQIGCLVTGKSHEPRMNSARPTRFSTGT